MGESVLFCSISSKFPKAVVVIMMKVMLSINRYRSHLWDPILLPFPATAFEVESQYVVQLDPQSPTGL